MLVRIIYNRLGGYNGIRRKYYATSSSFQKRWLHRLLEVFQNEYSCYLPLQFTLEGDINFPHGTSGIFISGGAKIGMNCTVYQQVTIGSNMLIDSQKLGSPTIGDNCLIGAGAKIIGNINIGHNCRIGANAVVTQDVPDNSVVVMDSMRVIQKENLDNTIYQNTSEGWKALRNGIREKVTQKEALEALENIEKRK